jgi:cephalosporin hydroxylase
MSNELNEFYSLRADSISNLSKAKDLQDLGVKLMRESAPYRYAYNFDWLGIPAIQLPTDLVAMQEIIWAYKPEVIIETGVAHGGSLVFYASMLTLLGNNGFVVGVDIEIRKHNRDVLESHPMYEKIKLVEGSSISSDIIAKIQSLVGNRRTLVVLDSDHSKDHVLQELYAYEKFVAVGGYIVVMDTTLEDQPDNFIVDRPWNKFNNPKTAVREFLNSRTGKWLADSKIDGKLLITVCKEGFLKKISE